MKRLSLLLVSAALLAGPVTAQTGVTPAPTPAKPAPKPKKICHETDTTDSRISKRVCKTAAEWAGDGDRDSIGVTGARTGPGSGS